MNFSPKTNTNLLEAVMMAYQGVSKQKAKQMLQYCLFKLDGKRIDKHPATPILAGQTLEIIKADTNKEKQVLPTRRELIALYFEDDSIVVALKPAGILSCGIREEKTNYSYHKLLENYLSDRDEKKCRLWVVHRLDREVEGLMLFSKSEKLQEKIKENWPQTIKKYLALTERKPIPPSGTIENWLVDTSSQKVVAHQKEVPGSKLAKTKYQFLRDEGKFFLVEVELYTGRKNQIRVHLSGMGCPIVGDHKYGADKSIKRQIRLAAYKIEFPHPVSGKMVSLHYRPSHRFFHPSMNQDENYKIV